jgi:hypothetical protein
VVWEEELDNSPDDIPELLETEDEVIDEGQEETLVLGAEDVVREANGDEEDILELSPLVTDKREDVVAGADIFEGTV